MELSNDIEQKVTTSCKEMNGWIKFIAIFSIAIGALYALTIFGIIIAWLPIWIGIILLKAANSSREVALGSIQSLADMLGSLKTFFLLSGILLIISTALSLIWFIVLGLATFGSMFDGRGFY